MKFDKSTAIKMRDEINEALKAVGQKNGMDIQLGRCTYDDMTLTYKLEVKNRDKEVAEQNEMARWKRNHALLGLEESDINRVIDWGGKKYTITGVEPSRSKFNLKVMNLENGKTYLLDGYKVSQRLYPEKYKHGMMAV